MAKRKSRRRRTPAVELTLNFALTEAGTNFISIPAALSMVNRKLYRSGYMYAVASVSLHATQAGFQPDCRVLTLPNSWPVRNGLVKSYHLWRQMNDKVLDDNPSLQGKWADFKPSMDAEHTASWQADNIGTLRPVDGGNVLYLAPEEWDQAQIVFPQHYVDPATGAPLAAVNRFLHVLGPDDVGADTVGIVQGYQDTRATVHAEDPADDPVDANNWMITLFDEGSSDPELADIVIDENDQPPYDQDMYPGADTNAANPHFQGYLKCLYDPLVGAAKNVDSMPGFLAPLGLLKIITSDVGGQEYLQIKLVPGNYRGVLAERIV